MHDRVDQLRSRTSEYRDGGAGCDTAGEEHSNAAEAGTGQPHSTPSAFAELIAVAPRRVLRPHRLTDPDQLGVIAQTRQADVLRGYALLHISENSLGLLDRFPPLIERSEIPALTRPAYHP